MPGLEARAADGAELDREFHGRDLFGFGVRLAHSLSVSGRRWRSGAPAQKQGLPLAEARHQTVSTVVLLEILCNRLAGTPQCSLVREEDEAEVARPGRLAEAAAVHHQDVLLPQQTPHEFLVA